MFKEKALRVFTGDSGTGHRRTYSALVTKQVKQLMYPRTYLLETPATLIESLNNRVEGNRSSHYKAY